MSGPLRDARTSTDLAWDDGIIGQRVFDFIDSRRALVVEEGGAVVAMHSIDEQLQQTTTKSWDVPDGFDRMICCAGVRCVQNVKAPHSWSSTTCSSWPVSLAPSGQDIMCG